MPYSANAIANYFVAKSHVTGKELTPMKLIKLVYVAHGWCLALFDRPLIDEPIEAWRYGPVIESVYQYFKRFGNEQVEDFARTIDDDIAPHVPNDDDVTRAMLDKTWELYGDYTGIQLSNWSHEVGSPWYETWHSNNGKGTRGCPIDNELIKNYFSRLKRNVN